MQIIKNVTINLSKLATFVNINLNIIYHNLYKLNNNARGGKSVLMNCIKSLKYRPLNLWENAKDVLLFIYVHYNKLYLITINIGQEYISDTHILKNTKKIENKKYQKNLKNKNKLYNEFNRPHPSLNRIIIS
jgi:hypothetical protein